MPRAARKHHRAAFRRPVDPAAEFRKHQVAAFEIAVEIDRDREAPMPRAGVDIVAMAMEVAADLAVVAGDDALADDRFVLAS
jgi:hypothetical protein